VNDTRAPRGAQSARADSESGILVRCHSMRLPRRMRWLFWEADFDALDTAKHDSYVLARVLEHGRMPDVRWAIDTYRMKRIHRFLRDVGHPELSARTLAFWRAALHAEREKWANAPAWRKSNVARWQG
jgi:hypothetical protein